MAPIEMTQVLDLIDTFGLIGLLLFISWQQARQLSEQRACHDRQYEQLLQWIINLCGDRMRDRE